MIFSDCDLVAASRSRELRFAFIIFFGLPIADFMSDCALITFKSELIFCTGNLTVKNRSKYGSGFWNNKLYASNCRIRRSSRLRMFWRRRLTVCQPDLAEVSSRDEEALTLVEPRGGREDEVGLYGSNVTTHEVIGVEDNPGVSEGVTGSVSDVAREEVLGIIIKSLMFAHHTERPPSTPTRDSFTVEHT